MVDDRLMNGMTMPETLKEIEEQGIKAIVEDSNYLNGAHDWAIILTVKDDRDLIKFMELWREYYGEYLSRVIRRSSSPPPAPVNWIQTYTNWAIC